MAELMNSSAESPLSKQQTQKLAQKISQQAKNKFLDFFDGVNTYAVQQIPEWQPNAQVIWQEGSTKILDYGGKGKTILFLSPLINRANILDLPGDKSLMKFLTAEGYRALLVDWGDPTEAEENFDSDAYVARLARFCATQKDLIIGGYCMGGLLALKTAKLVNPKALILLATPWNFHAPDVKRIDVPENMMQEFLGAFTTVPPEFIQTLFLTADPWRVYNKYSAFNKIPPKQRKATMEVEHWVNSGVQMAVPMARECIINWSIDNTPGKGEWLDLASLKMPAYLGCPTNDKIVPIGCSVPLAGLLENATLQKFPSGHIGMLTKKLCFEPLADWLKFI